MAGDKLTVSDLDAFLALDEREPSAYLEAAAVMDSYDPLTIKPATGSPNEADRAAILDELLPKSEALPPRNRWTLLFHERRAALRRLGDKQAMRVALQANGSSIPDTPVQRMLSRVLSESTPLSLETLTRDELAALITVIGWLEGIVTDLPMASAARRALAREDFLAPMKRLTAAGFINRERELDQLTQYIGLVSPAPLFVYGTGGVGKSSLLAQFVLTRLIPAGACVAYVDLDRPSIRPEQPMTIVLELVRQFQAQLDLPADEVDAFAKEASYAIGRQDVTRQLESATAGTANTSDVLHALAQRLPYWLRGPGVLIIDTMEEAQYLGADVMSPLVDFLLRLYYNTGLRVILSGRGLPDEFTAQAFTDYAGQVQRGAETEEEKRNRIDAIPLAYRPINLTELDPDSARLMLRAAMKREGISPLSTAEENDLIGIVSRNPMCLRLAARVVRDEGADRLRSSRSEFLAKLKAEKIQALLYSRILLNLHREDVRKVAYPGLVVRRITPGVIKEVLAEPCELTLTETNSETNLFLELRREAALMDPDPTDYYVLYHRPDVRRTMLLDLTDHVDSAVVEEIHSKAIAYYQKDLTPAGRAEELYHRLSRGEQPAVLDGRWLPEAASFLRNVEDLPAQQRLWLAEKLGVSLDETIRSTASQEAWEQQVAASANRFLLAGSPTEALKLLRERQERLPRSPLFNLEAEALRFMSDFDGALEVARRGIDSAGRAGATDMALELLLKMALLEERRSHFEESLSLVVEATGVAAHSANPILQLSVRIASIRLQRKMRPDALEERAATIEDTIHFLTPDLLRKLRAYPIVLREAATELAKYDSRIASLAIEVRGLELENDHQAQALGEALARLKESRQADAGSRITSGVASFERANFDPSVVRNWAKEVLTHRDIRAVSSALKSDDVAHEKLAEHLGADEPLTLEAIILPEARPLVFIRGNSYDHLTQSWTHLNASEVRARIESVLPSIGRIELPDYPLIPFAGTGFIAGPNLIATARHVAQIFAHGVGLDIRYRPGAAVIDFNRTIDAQDSDRSRQCQIVAVEMIHPYWDFALLRAEGLSGRSLCLSSRPTEDLYGSEVVVVGYPVFDPRRDRELQDKIFGGIYNVKRLMPGIIRDREKVKSFDNIVSVLTHDASTLGSSSGSPLIHVGTGEVVGIQFASEYLKANYAVPAFELARDRRLTTALNFSGSLPTPAEEWEQS